MDFVPVDGIANEYMNTTNEKTAFKIICFLGTNSCRSQCHLSHSSKLFGKPLKISLFLSISNNCVVPKKMEVINGSV